MPPLPLGQQSPPPLPPPPPGQHGDINPLDEEHKLVKLDDFGLPRQTKRPFSSRTVTKWYLPVWTMARAARTTTAS